MLSVFEMMRLKFFVMPYDVNRDIIKLSHERNRKKQGQTVQHAIGKIEKGPGPISKRNKN